MCKYTLLVYLHYRFDRYNYDRRYSTLVCYSTTSHLRFSVNHFESSMFTIIWYLFINIYDIYLLFKLTVPKYLYVYLNCWINIARNIKTIFFFVFFVIVSIVSYLKTIIVFCKDFFVTKSMLNPQSDDFGSIHLLPTKTC